MCSSFKQDLLSGLHCLNAVITFTATGTSTVTWTAVSALTGLAVGMTLSGTNVAAGTVIASIDSATAITVSKASTGALGTVTATGDAYKVALIKVAPAGTFGAASTNYTDLSTDEVASGGGYTTAGNALTNNGNSLTTTVAFTDFADTSWTSATFSTTACMIYNNARRGPVATRATSTHDFGGTQTVSAGTLTLVFPAADSTNAILRIA